MVAARARLEIATGNLANVSTDGFHASLARGRLTAHGVEIARVASQQRGALVRTGRPFDFAILGRGWFRVRDRDGHVSSSRNGAFERDRDGLLRDGSGSVLLGLYGPARVPEGASVDERGRVMLGGKRMDRILYGGDATLRAGFVETADVNAIQEMVTVLAAQRSFESAQKVVSAIDGTRQKASNEIARLK